MLPGHGDLLLQLLVAADEMAARGEVADRQPGPQALHLDVEQVVRLVGGPAAPRQEVYRFDLQLFAAGDVALDCLQGRRIVLAEHRGVHSDFHQVAVPFALSFRLPPRDQVSPGRSPARPADGDPARMVARGHCLNFHPAPSDSTLSPAKLPFPAGHLNRRPLAGLARATHTTDAEAACREST